MVAAGRFESLLLMFWSKNHKVWRSFDENVGCFFHLSQTSSYLDAGFVGKGISSLAPDESSDLFWGYSRTLWQKWTIVGRHSCSCMRFFFNLLTSCLRFLMNLGWIELLHCSNLFSWCFFIVFLFYNKTGQWPGQTDYKIVVILTIVMIITVIVTKPA